MITIFPAYLTILLINLFKQPEIDFRYDDHHWRDIRVEMDVYKVTKIFY